MSEAPHSMSDVQAFSQAKLDQLVLEHKPVFVYATAAWCITCKYNERTVLDTAPVREAFQKNKIEILIADWTNKNTAILNYLQTFNRQGVPLYVLYNRQGQPTVLPQILTKQIVLDAVNQLK